MAVKWKVGAGSSGEGLYYKAGDNVGRLHLALGIERDDLDRHPEYPYGEPGAECCVVDTLIVWEKGNPAPAKYERVMIPQAALVRALKQHEGPQGIMLAWLAQPGNAYIFNPPADELLAFAGRWLDEYAHLRDGRIAVTYENPDQPKPEPDPEVKAFVDRARGRSRPAARSGSRDDGMEAPF